MKKFNLAIWVSLLIVVLLAVEVVVVKSVSKYEPLVTVVFAKAKIPAKTLITPEMLVEKKINISMVNRLSVGSIKDIAGKKPKADIEDGEMVLKSRIGDIDEMEEIPVVDKNNRLYTLELTGAQANGFWLKVGQYVDIICVPDEKMVQLKATVLDPPVSDSSAHPGGVVGTVNNSPVLPEGDGKVKKLSNIRIAALIDDKGNLLKNTSRNAVPKYITFEVTGEEVDYLAQAKENEKLSLAVIPGDAKGGN